MKLLEFSRFIRYFIRVCMMFFCVTVGAAEISSVSYIHSSISSQKSIVVPIDINTSINEIGTLKYLMRQIDKANEILNGFPTSDYANSDMAKPLPVTSEKASQDIEQYIKEQESFYFILTAANSFDFKISASGNFTIDWGDGTIEPINKPNTNNTTYSHTYATTVNYKVKLRGKATGYSVSSFDNLNGTISFYESTTKDKMTSIGGSLGTVFPTIGGQSPNFTQTFSECSNLTGEIPPDLFTGITAPAPFMFMGTFSGASFTGSIPPELFAGIKGIPQEAMFAWTFENCQNLTGPIPGNLFAGIKGAPAHTMFAKTFSGCGGLTGSIPGGLFSGIQGAPVGHMFEETFQDCTGLTGPIPAELFAGISGPPAQRMFSYTFKNCSGLTSIPAGLFGRISGSGGVLHGFRGTFRDCTGLTGLIPSGLFGKITGQPTSLFDEVFYGCSGLIGIQDGIWDLSEVPYNMNYGILEEAFYGCSGLLSNTPNIAPGSTEKLWERFIFSFGYKTFTGATNLADYNQIPALWK